MRSSSVLLAALLALRCAHEPPAPPPDPVAAARSDPAALERGRKIFVGTCAGYCHVASGHGLGNAPDLLDCEWRHGSTDPEIFGVMRNGVPGTPMLGFAGKIPDEDLWRVLAYLRSASHCRAP
jgi:mono/diheme cytochrome c family protein